MALHTIDLIIIGWLAVIGIIYGALAAWVQPDMKRLVAYSSVSHLGFCVLGLAAMTTEAVTGSVYQMLAHGLSTGGLFLLVGVLYERRHTRELADYGGIARRVPRFTFFLVFTALASAGLPALSGFPGEFLILLGTFTGGAHPLGEAVNLPVVGAVQLNQLLAVLGATGVILAAVYLLYMVQKVLFGPLQNPANERLTDMGVREVVVMVPLVVGMLWLGLAPGSILSSIEISADNFVKRVHQRSGHTYRPDTGAAKVALRRAPAPTPSAAPSNGRPKMKPIKPRMKLRPVAPSMLPDRMLRRVKPGEMRGGTPKEPLQLQRKGRSP